MKTKDKLLLFLALNVASTPLLAGTSKYEKLYDKMTKNLEKGKSNDESYKLIEMILNKRNKELKDLYLQNDYTIKPEFLEWQIFFTNFYSHANNKGKEKEFNSKIEGTEKKIDLGMSISVNGIKKYKTNLDINPVINPIPNINVEEIKIKAPHTIEIDPVEIKTLTLPLSVGRQPRLGYQFMGGGTEINFAYETRYNKTGRVMFENLNLKPTGENTVITGTYNSKIGMKGSINYKSNDETINDNTLDSEERSYYDKFIVSSISRDGDYKIEGNWIFNSRAGTFLAYTPAYTSVDSSVTNYANIDVKNYGTGLYLNLHSNLPLDGLTSRLINKGNINVEGGSGIRLGSPFNEKSYLKGEIINDGKITVKSANDESNRGVGIQVDSVYGKYDNNSKGIIKIGNIDLIGAKNDEYEFSDIGVFVDSSRNMGHYFNNLVLDGSNGVINVLGDKNQGLLIANQFNKVGSLNVLDNIKNININLGGTNGIGFSYTDYLNAHEYTAIVSKEVIKSIVVNENAKGNALILLGGVNGVFTKDLADSIDNNKGEGNTVLKQIGYSYGKMYSVKNYMPIYIGSGTKSGIGIDADVMENYGDIVVESTWDPSVTSRSVGILSGLQRTFDFKEYHLKNYANVTMNTDNSIGLWARLGWLESSGGNIQ